MTRMQGLFQVMVSRRAWVALKVTTTMMAWD